jgi:putative ABC transport system permease protein
MLPRFLRQIRARWKYRHFEQDLVREIETHRAMAESDFGSASATRQLGNVTLAREESRAMWIPTLFQQFEQDARYALRGLRRAPGFAIAAISMLTIGLGLVVGGFTVFNGRFIREWQLPESDQVFKTNVRRAQDTGDQEGFGVGAFAHVRTHARSADYVGANIEYFAVSTDGAGRGASQLGAAVTDNFLDALQIPLQRGNGFRGIPKDSPPGVVISHGIWRRVFAGDPNVIGRSLWLNAIRSTVVGVTAQGFEALGGQPLAVVVDIADAKRLNLNSTMALLANDTACCLDLVAGRMRDDATRSSVREELQLLTSQFRQSASQPAVNVSVIGTAPWDDAQFQGRTSAGGFIFALVSVGLILVMLLTLANVGNLFLARSLRRQREVAVRLSLGASRARVARQFLTEGLVLAGIAGAAVFLVAAGVPFVLRRLGNDVSAALLGPDWRVAAFTSLVVVIACLVVSLAPAIHVTQVVWNGLKGSLAARVRAVRGVVLAVQVAIAAVLVLSASLIARGIEHAASVPADYARDTTTVVTLQAPAGKPFSRERRAEVRDALEPAFSLSGTRVGLAWAASNGRLELGNYPLKHLGSDQVVQVKFVPLSASSFQVLSIPLVSGRWASDQPTAAEAVVNETLARQLEPVGGSLGRAVRLSYGDKTYTVVGVVRDVHLTALDVVEPMFFADPPASLGLPRLLVRAGTASEESVKNVMASIDPQLRVSFFPLSRGVGPMLENAKAGAAMAASLASIALLLAIIGIFGAFTYLIEQRRSEIGLRIALGASRRQIASALYGACRGPLVGGLLAGLVMSAAAGVALRRFLFGLSPADPISYLSVAVVLLTAAFVATAIPVRRALRVDPAAALKAE